MKIEKSSFIPFFQNSSYSHLKSYKKTFHFNDILYEKKQKRRFNCLQTLRDFFNRIWNYCCCCFKIKKKSTTSSSESSSDSPQEKYKSTKNYPVTGIQSGSNNCCLNSVVQGIATIPSWRSGFENNPFFKGFLKAYDEANKKGVALSKKYCDLIRDLIGMNQGTQEDVSEILVKIFEQEPQAPIFYLKNPKGFAEPQTALYFYRNSCHKIYQFKDLFLDSFRRDDGFRPFFYIPTNFTIYNSVFIQKSENKTKDSKASIKVDKNNTPIQGKISTFTLPREVHNLEIDIQYICDFFIVHSGSVNFGHYQSVRKIENQWYLINDSSVSKISEQSAEKLLQTAVLFHFSRLES